jgi:hypothetical protein
MPWFTGDELRWGVMLAALAIAAAGTVWTTVRGRQRNDEGRCARCGVAWSARYPDLERSLIAGAHVCAPCTATVRRRAVRGLAVLAATIVGVAVATVVLNGYDMLHGHLPFGIGRLTYWAQPVAVLGAAAAALTMWMKRANRRALAARTPTEEPDGDEPRRLMPPASWPGNSAAHRDVSATLR